MDSDHREGSGQATGPHLPLGQFQDFGLRPPGWFDPRVFEQRKWWVDYHQRPHLISDVDDFTTEHLLAVLRFVYRNAWRWADFSELGDEDPIDLGWFTGESQRRIVETPLVRELLAEAARRRVREVPGRQ